MYGRFFFDVLSNKRGMFDMKYMPHTWYLGWKSFEKFS